MADELKIKVRYDTEEGKRDLDGLERETIKSAESQASMVTNMASRAVKGVAALATIAYAPVALQGADAAKNYLQNLARLTPGYGTADAVYKKSSAEQQSYLGFAREFGLVAGLAKQQGDQGTIDSLMEMAKREANYAKTAAEGESLLSNELLKKKASEDSEYMFGGVAERLTTVLEKLEAFLNKFIP